MQTIQPINETNAVTNPLKLAVQQFDHWRATRKKRGPIPESLLVLANSLTNQYGFTKIVKTLKLNGSDLKKRLKTEVKINQTKQMEFVECSHQIPLQSINPIETQSRSIEFSFKNTSTIVKLNGLNISEVQHTISQLIGQISCYN